MERLQKQISALGYCSRRKAEELIVKGLVKVNGTVVTYVGPDAVGTGTISAKIDLATGTNAIVNDDKSITISSATLNTDLTILPKDANGLVVDDKGIHLPGISEDAKKRYIELWIADGGAFTWDPTTQTLTLK